MQKLLISIILISIILLPKFSSGQYSDKDLELIKKQDFYNKAYEKRQVKYLFSESGPFVKYNPLSLVLGSLMFTYQKVISPQFSSSCLFDPSCSNFSIQLIREYGLVKGIALSADRITRCSRIASTDIHPMKVDEHTGKALENTNMFKWKRK